MKRILLLLAILVLASIWAPVTSAEEPCNGRCWEIAQPSRTIEWTGPDDGSEDVWQADEFLALVREGYTVKFPTTVPGEIEICTGQVQVDEVVSYEGYEGCQSDLKVSAGKIIVTNSVGTSGGFRWKPAPGYGWRAPQPTELTPTLTAAPTKPTATKTVAAATAPTPTPTPGFPWWWLIPPALIALLVGAAWLFRRRRGSDDESES